MLKELMMSGLYLSIDEYTDSLGIFTGLQMLEADDDLPVSGITGFTGDPILGDLQMMTSPCQGLPASPVIPFWGICR